MGLLTFAAIKTEISHHFANRADIEDRLNTVIDLAQMRVARLHDWDQLKFLVQGTLSSTGTALADKVYDLSSDLPAGYRIKNLYSVRVISSDGRSRKLTGKTHSEFDALVPEPEWYARRMPEMFVRSSSIQGSTQITQALELWPVPDEDYAINLRIQIWPRSVTDEVLVDGDYSDLDVDDAIISLATSYLYNSLGREDKAKHHFGIYTAIVRDALRLDESDFDSVIAGVKVDGTTVGNQYWLDPFVKGV
jgi:hypothetical protein